MATPVVTVSFTADVQCGLSPLTVNFTDTSTVDVGFLRQWFWSFGDGEISEDQNPTHVYTGDPGESYTVELMVLATTGEFDALNKNTVSATRVSNDGRLYGVGFTNEDAWNARAVSELSSGKAQHSVGFNGAQYFYTTNTPILSLNTGRADASFSQIMTEWSVFDNDYMTLTGQVSFAGYVGSTGINGQMTPFGRLTNVPADPLIATATVFPEVQLASPTAGLNVGMVVLFHRRTWPTTSTQGFGENEEVDFIGLASVPVPDFSASPSLGNNPLSVVFTNLTAESNCGSVATYSWKKRVSGSGDAFVEFSTEKNPTEIFTK